ncbi:spinster family MFS transporter [Sphingomonas immobilis]|uniref:MFS transporter n=1 Tax=Sphingomonas immobilis TaxID=3063997 RepID=A0ABT9A2Z9_9SPHN|nr:MFS transporter [Sphingomonas sp. CA1-15]MDO7843605.1 MFS transporter [Sphingomonas sp. CA1-15]
MSIDEPDRHEETDIVPRWGALILLMLVYCVHSIDRNAFNVLLQPISREFKLSDGQTGLLAGFVYTIPFALAAIPLATLADRVNRKHLLAILLTTWSVATLLARWAGSFGSLAGLRALVGAAEAGSPPTCLSMISDHFPPRLRPTAVSVFYIGAPIGVLVGSVVAGKVSGVWGWRWAMMAIGLPGILLAVILMLALRNPPRRTAQTDVLTTSAPARQIVAWFMIPGIALTVLAMVIASMVVLGVGSWASVLLIRERNVPIAAAGAALGLVLGAGGIAGTLLGGVAARFRADRGNSGLPVIAGLAALIGAPCLAVALASRSEILTLVALAPYSVLLSAYYGPAFGFCLNLAPSPVRARALSVVFILCNVVGGGLGPLAIGLLSDWRRLSGDRYPVSHALGLMVALAMLAGLLFLGAGYSMRRAGEGANDVGDE